jgi:hypothetical protein
MTPVLAILAVAAVGAFLWSMRPREARDADEDVREARPPAPARERKAPSPAPGADNDRAPRTRPRRAFLSVNVTPATATVTLDGEPLRDGGFALEASDRPRTLVAEAPGHERYESRLIVQANERVNVVLEPSRPSPGTGRAQRERDPRTYRGKLGISKNPFGSGGSSSP